MSNNSEKRKHPRVDVSVPLRYKELRGKKYLADGTMTKNVSEGGVRFRANRFISLACHLLVEMKLPSLAKPIKAVSKVAWIKKLGTDNDYEIGNHFLALSNEDEEALSKYVKENIKA